MSNEDKIELDGTCTKAIKGAKFEVEIDGNNHKVICTLAGKLMKNSIKIIPGDRVTVHISPYDLSKGIIVWRFR